MQGFGNALISEGGLWEHVKKPREYEAFLCHKSLTCGC